MSKNLSDYPDLQKEIVQDMNNGATIFDLKNVVFNKGRSMVMGSIINNVFTAVNLYRKVDGKWRVTTGGLFYPDGSSSLDRYYFEDDGTPTIVVTTKSRYNDELGRFIS